MKIYTDYDFYSNTYKGDMPEEKFGKLVIGASYEVQKNIFNRDITGYEDEVKLATCSVADILLKIEQIEEKKSKLISSANSDKIIASESVGDYSRTFANSNDIKDLDTQISDQKEKIKEELKKYLLNTGLLFRGV